VYADAEQGARRAVVAISPTATSPLLSGRSAWLFRVCPSDVAASQAVARYVLDSLRARRAVIMYRNDVYGKGWSRAFTDAYRAGGGQVLRRAPHLTGMSEWRPYAAYVAKLDPDVVLFPGSPQDIEPFLRELRAAGVRARVVGGDAVSELEEKSAEFRGVYYTAFFLPDQAPGEEGRKFVEAYRRRWGNTQPDQRAALAYDAAMLIGRAARSVGADRRRVRDYIAGVGIARPPVQGATGPIAFDARHDVVGKPVVIARVGR
jgi:branched-chain amino acid transport system substrate-binding protein